MDASDRPSEIEITAFSADIDEENHRRRYCSGFGYRHGGTWNMVIWMVVMIILAGCLVWGLAFAAPGSGTTLVASPLFWVALLPMLAVPIVPFLFLKLRYALLAIAIMTAIVVVVIFRLCNTQNKWVLFI